MRNTFIEELIAQARVNPRIFLIVGDLGFSVVEPFADEFPDRFLNAGVAEQNMTGVAAGLASEGYHAFTYSIANFPTLRCLEQIRNDVCYHHLPVTVVSVGAGLAYGNLGYSHHAVQDVACLRGMPNITILSPADQAETRECVRYLASHPGPSYLRLGKAGAKALYAAKSLTAFPQLVAGESTAEAAIVAVGSVLAEALAAHESSRGSAAIYSMPWLCPVDDFNLAPLWQHKRLLVIEEHVGAGGAAELLAARRPDGTEVVPFVLACTNSDMVGSQEYLREHSGLSRNQLQQTLEKTSNRT